MKGPWEDTPKYSSSFPVYLEQEKATELRPAWDALSSTILKLCFEKMMEDDRGTWLWRATHQTIQVSDATLPLLGFR